MICTYNSLLAIYLVCERQKNVPARVNKKILQRGLNRYPAVLPIMVI